MIGSIELQSRSTSAMYGVHDLNRLVNGSGLTAMNRNGQTSRLNRTVETVARVQANFRLIDSDARWRVVHVCCGFPV